MPLKTVCRGKGKGKQVDNRFVNAKARQNFESQLRRRDKGLIPERGLTGTHADFWARGRGWGRFMQEPAHLAIEPIVREFYANFPECDGGTVFVRGIDVPITAGVINDFYQLPPVDHDGYLALKRTQFDEGDILRVLTKPGTQWEVSKKGKKSIKGTNLLPMARLWQYFVSARLVPELHYSTVTYDKVLVLYAIATGRSIDVGELIMTNIKHAAQPGRGSFPFPHLITELCCKAGVEKMDDDKLLHPGPILDTAYYHKHLASTASAAPTHTPKRQRTSHGPTSSSSSSGSIKGMLQKMMGDLKRMQCRQDWLAEQTQMMHEMQRSCFSALNVDTSSFQWADWDSEEWMGSAAEEGDTDNEDADA